MVLTSLVCAHVTGNRNPSTEYAVAVSFFFVCFSFSLFTLINSYLL